MSLGRGSVNPGRFFILLAIIVAVAITLGVLPHVMNRTGSGSWLDNEPVGNTVKDVGARKPAPDFGLKDVNGKVVHLSDYKGKVVLLDFWATWCGPCGIEIPWFTDFQREYKDRGLVVLGVSMDDGGWNDVKPFVAQQKINYPIVLGDQKVSDQYGDVEALPTTFVIDRQGRIASIHVGLVGKKEFDDAIQKLL